MKDEEKTKLLLEIIKRFDGYISSTNTKCTIYLSYFAASTGWLILSHLRLPPLPVSNHLSLCSTLILSAIVITSSLILTIKALQVIFPITKSNSTTNNGHSLIYYGDISRRKPNAYTEEILNLDSLSSIKDLSEQAHILAVITNNKFNKIKSLANLTTTTHTIPLFILIAIQLFNAISGRYLV